ncbi:hypothetical protein HWB90_gp005 [Mycobacterium phage Fowlmouth]|uniref:Uncharacterized protein n=2 Tax=Fowlmouthvirus fowlmouth TaxID=2845652 RepID=A0A7G8LPP8_9CAUD|nr:hypothetical protein HWB90_gp005 [Mycobacterium phage Fowlmouth]AYN57955.1 hypothetical protein SEA_FOWLMOUTH_5 [Mycobacterium phage Fowlmouth]QNJ59220.1 hypothetical protein SEA_MRMIYAGI_5 [Mycobacterium phage MrMiyagi]
MAVNRLGQSMVGRKAGNAVKQPAKMPATMKGKNAGKAKTGGSGKSLKMANGVSSGIIKTAF